MIIIGGGLAGCLAAYRFKEAIIYEAAPEPSTQHRAVLRFKTDAISKLTGIKMERVNVYKGIVYNGMEVSLSPKMIALYSKKVTGSYAIRSITDLGVSTRWIPPSNFHMCMMDDLHAQGRLRYGMKLTRLFRSGAEFNNSPSANQGAPIISTIPISRLADCASNPLETDANFQSIYVNIFRVPDSVMNATVYFPSAMTSIYRASLVADRMIVESMRPMDGQLEIATDALGVHPTSLILKDHEQRIGKLVPIDEIERRRFILTMTRTYGVYSLGRFATWRNVVLDDIVQDLDKIHQLMTVDDYERYKA